MRIFFLEIRNNKLIDDFHIFFVCAINLTKYMGNIGVVFNVHLIILLKSTKKNLSKLVPLVFFPRIFQKNRYSCVTLGFDSATSLN